jgi:SAM-dependent methyltransferase
VEPKPAQWGAEFGAWFTDQAIAEAYPNRPPYPQDAIELLVSLIADTPRNVLDAGCGTGDVARRLAPYVDRVDAVDASAAMLAEGRRLPGGDHPNLSWRHATAEEAVLAPPYALVTAGESLHWMDWPVVLPRFAGALAPHGALAIVERDWDGPPVLTARLRPIFARYSTVRDFRAMDVVAEIERRGLFTRTGEQRCGPQPWRPTVEEYLACRHSQRGFSRAHMPAAPEFDEAVRATLEDLVETGELGRSRGRLELTVEARVVWGVPRV